jgi:urease accessory protein
VVSHAYATSPLRLLMPRNHGHAAWIYTSSFGGGLVDGDRIVMDLTIAEGASAFLSTQAATKVYRSPCHGTSAELRARVGAGGLLVAAPDPVVCFAAARYRQVQCFDLEPDAALVAIDWLSSGRWAAGERWAFREYLAQLSVRVEGKLVVHDVLGLRAEDGDLGARMGRFEVMAIAVLIAVGAGGDVRAGAQAKAGAQARASAEAGAGAEAEVGGGAGAAAGVGARADADANSGAGLEARGARLREAAAGIVSRIDDMTVARRADQLLAATRLRSGCDRERECGCVVRIAGMSVEQVGRTLRELLAFVPAMLGDDPWTRKW